MAEDAQSQPDQSVPAQSNSSLETSTYQERLAHDAYTVGWVCALPKERTAAGATLDEEHQSLPTPRNDHNSYNLGSICGHNVVIACLPNMGTNPAATVATSMISTSQSIRFGHMVGIGGGIPSEVNLGDVVVSHPVADYPGVAQWDMGKLERGWRFVHMGSLNRPPNVLVNASNVSKSNYETYGSKINEYLDDVTRKLARLAIVDPTFRKDEGGFLFLNPAIAQSKYRIPPTKRCLRLHRQKLRGILASGLDIQYGKAAQSFRELPKGQIEVVFADKTTAQETLLVGADGNNSGIRTQLCAQPALNKLPVNLIGVVRHFTPAQAAAVRAIDPLLFQALHPTTGNYLWFSFQECTQEPNGERSYTALVLISWLVHDETADAIPPTSRERIQNMKRRAEGFAEPLRTIVMDISGDESYTTPLRLGDYVPDVEQRWDNLGGRVTLAGDAAHAMTMYCGEDANHGILDVVLLEEGCQGGCHTGTGCWDYDEEMCRRTKDAVLLSRRAALGAHVWEKVNDESAVYSGENSSCYGLRML